MDVKLFDSELKVMEVLWERGETICQGHCFRTVRAYWVEQNTTYTVIKNVLKKVQFGGRNPDSCAARLSRGTKFSKVRQSS